MILKGKQSIIFFSIICFSILFYSCDLFRVIETYTVTYDANESTSGSVPSDSNEYEAGEPVTVLGNPGNLQKSGYTFGGWNTEVDGSGITYQEGQSFSIGLSDITLYAIWDIEKYEVTYYGNGNDSGSVPSDSNQYAEGEEVTVKGNTDSLIKDGYTFGGWNTSSDGTGIGYSGGDALVVETTNINLYAVWIGNEQFQVFYDGNNQTAGTPPVDDSEYQFGYTVTLLDNIWNLEKEGLRFGGWNTEADGTGTRYLPDDTIPMPGGDITLYAMWLPPLSVTYVANNATQGDVPVDTNEYILDDTVEVLGNTGNLEKTGYTFGGWNTEVDGSGTTYTGGDTLSIGSTDLSLYALWREHLSIHYDGNTNSSGNPPVDSNIYLEGESVTTLCNLGSLEKTNYSFMGWNTASDGSGIRYSERQIIIMPSSDITLYADWEINTYAINFNSDGGSVVASQEIDHGAKIDEPAIPTKKNYSFGGWFKEPELDNSWDFGTDVVTEDTTLYVKWDSIYPETFAGGSGTEEDPYQVETAGHLYIVRNHLDKHFIQTDDIDLSAFCEGGGWDPIGAWYGDGFVENEIFVGSFDGDGYIISDLTINRGERDAIGLFGYVGGTAIITGVTLEDISILGRQFVGGLIGLNESYEELSHCSVSGTVYANGSVGGLIGSNTSGKISHCNTAVDVLGYRNTGGLIGGNSYSDISDSYATGIVTGGYRTGGLVGYNYNGDLNDCYAAGDVIGNGRTGGLIGDNNDKSNISTSYATGDVAGDSDHTGGLIGYNSGYNISTCYATGDVTGYRNTGGLIGGKGGCISNSYARGTVEGTQRVGGLIGGVSGDVKQCFSTGAVTGTVGVGGLIGALPSGTVEEVFYDTNTSGRSDTNQGTPKTTTEMMQQATFENWDFTDIWAIDEGESYPYLQWEKK
ncbi:MAG: InlB B-repeat-containing protein [Spirochaetia bacterium]|nr:InlB B-repeat-containing protein [Spirochaetia bacterium]